jgi:hypothetical protein
VAKAHVAHVWNLYSYPSRVSPNQYRDKTFQHGIKADTSSSWKYKSIKVRHSLNFSSTLSSNIYTKYIIFNEKAYILTYYERTITMITMYLVMLNC